MIKGKINLEEVIPNTKATAFLEALRRKQLIHPEFEELTVLGEEVLTAILDISQDKTPKVLIKESKKLKETDFDLFWKAFPATNQFEYGGKFFEGTRNLKQDKSKCQEKFNKILAEGEFTAKDLIDAITLQVLIKKKESVKTGENKMQFINNSLTWLNQRVFEAYIELIRNNKTNPLPEEPKGTIPMGAVDI